MRPIIYPKCALTFRSFYKNDKVLTNKYINKLHRVGPFDVTLRDGLQGLSKDEQLIMKPIDLINLYNEIESKYRPKNMEIGSIVSKTIFPIFENSSTLFNHVEWSQHDYLGDNNINDEKIKNYILIPNEKQFEKRNQFIGLENFSFILSISDSFQMKNTKMSIDTAFKQIKNMIRQLDDEQCHRMVKLYVSCINECPIEGKIDNDKVVEKLLKYQELNPDILCLSDTCGTLTEDDFSYIINNINKNKIYDNISLHLHVKPDREDEVEKIFHRALDFGITSFDVSALDTGGCSVTMDRNKLAPNMSYEQYYKFLTNYLLK